MSGEMAAFCLSAALALFPSVLGAYDWSGTLLNNNASPADCDVLKDGDGNIIVYGTDGTWSGGHTRHQIFDGVSDGSSNYFDPPSDAASIGNCWAGIGFSKPKLALRIRFTLRPSFYTRIKDCLIQGANLEDFSDAVTIHVVTMPTSDKGWNDQWLVYPNTEYRAYRFFRLVGPVPYITGVSPQWGMMCGNCAELEFYGIDAEDWPSVADAPGACALQSRCVAKFNGMMNFQAQANASGNLVFEVQRRRPGEEYQFVAAFSGNNGWGAICFPDDMTGDVYYRMRARNPNGASVWSEWIVPYTYPNLGSYIGTQSSYNNKGDFGYKVFDGDTTNFADASAADATANNVWFGQDLGSERVITSFRYVARESHPYMEQAYFQIANDAEFTENVRTVHTIPSRPAANTIVTAVLNTPVTARYVRYHAADGRYGNAAEIEFSSQIVDRPAGLASAYNGGGITLSWNAYAGNDARVNKVKVYRRTIGEVDWTCIATIEAAVTTYTDEKVGWRPVFAYALAYAGDSVEGAKCPQIVAGAIRQLERDPIDLTRLRDGVGVVWRGFPYKTDNTAAMALKAFDGDESTCCDLSSDTSWNSGSDVAFGVDFGAGKGFALASARICARSNFPERANGAIIYGSNSENGNWYEDAVPISEPIVVDKDNLHCVVISISAESWRYMFIRQPDSAVNFWGNVMELELFGFKPGPCGTALYIR